MNIKELNDQKLNDEIERYADGIETLKERIREEPDNFTKNSIGEMLRQYTKVWQALKEEKIRRRSSFGDEMNASEIEAALKRVFDELQTKAIFFKDSFPGKIHFQMLYQNHHSELSYTPKKVYQVYLPFYLNNRIITKNSQEEEAATIDYLGLRKLLSDTFGKLVFIQKVEPDKGRNAFDRNTNPDVAAFLNLEAIDLWQGIMFYFFV